MSFDWGTGYTPVNLILFFAEYEARLGKINFPRIFRRRKQRLVRKLLETEFLQLLIDFDDRRAIGEAQLCNRHLDLRALCDFVFDNVRKAAVFKELLHLLSP